MQMAAEGGRGEEPGRTGAARLPQELIDSLEAREGASQMAVVRILFRGESGRHCSMGFDF